jgi:hypothetical protein
MSLRQIKNFYHAKNAPDFGTLGSSPISEAMNQ